MSPQTLAYIALSVSLTSLLLAFINFRRSDPRLNFDVQMLEPDAEDGLVIRVHNSGRAARTIDFTNVNFWSIVADEGKSYPVGPINGPALPHRLDGYSTQEWRASASNASRLFWRYGYANLGVSLGGRSKLQHIPIRELDPSKLGAKSPPGPTGG
jgi:hypothetical protein